MHLFCVVHVSLIASRTACGGSAYLLPARRELRYPLSKGSQDCGKTSGIIRMVKLVRWKKRWNIWWFFVSCSNKLGMRGILQHCRHKQRRTYKNVVEVLVLLTIRHLPLKHVIIYKFWKRFCFEIQESAVFTNVCNYFRDHMKSIARVLVIYWIPYCSHHHINLEQAAFT